jgi:hypothetical protein
MRKGYREYLSRRQADGVDLLRTYDHPQWSLRRFAAQLNPGKASPRTRIWMAARATSAAPGFFRKIRIDGAQHMDGGVRHSNPATLAYNEALQMIESPEGPEREPGLFLSIGTGIKGEPAIFGGRFGDLPTLTRFKLLRAVLTDTAGAHNAMLLATRNGKITPYIRLDVQHGLKDIPLDAWKTQKSSVKQAGLNPDPDLFIHSGNNSYRKRTTLQTIIDSTNRYLEDERVRESIEQCAQILFNYKRKRCVNDRRWKAFISNQWDPDWQKTPGDPTPMNLTALADEINPVDSIHPSRSSVVS